MGNTISSRPEDGNPLKIWDVPTLWELAKDIPVLSVRIDTLGELDRVAWYGADQHSGRLTVRQFVDHAKRIEHANLAEPILLSSEGKLLDGFHRIAKAFMIGQTHVLAKRFDVDPAPIRNVEMPDYIYRTYFPESITTR
ncbi:MAG: hypothetical protein WC661_06965 [Opitutaceae bacterium]|jgi:hypothetical protein